MIKFKKHSTFILSAFVILNAATSLPVLANSNATKNEKPSFEDNFQGNALDTNKWVYRGSGKRNYCINDKSSVSVKDNKLVITTYSKKNSQGVLENYCGMISTDGKFKQKYGYWEASIRFNSVQGVQPAFWVQSNSVGSDIKNPEKSGVEIDVFEHLAEAKKNEYDNALHWNGYGADHKQWAKKYANTNINDGKFHKYSVEWTPEHYIFYLDGKETARVAKSTAPISEAEQYIILSTEVPRANFPQNGFGDEKQSVATMEVEYIKVYPYLAGN